ncbi:phosphate/phosphite/phosphonate ABC transporter substrate-binding protein [Sphingomonas sp. R86520]|uniref:phosphate/phosphite/phosphonate ABC transporter substrate-binding protein n=1 Tax=Sphingomonas sp. R86520 TaxID=3093859 RepID=UPI0036D33070
MTARIASLGMYDHPAQHAANDQLWAAVARTLRGCGVTNVPDRLDRTRDVDAIWHDPGLLFGQACGYPLVVDGTLALQVLGFPVYDTGGSDTQAHGSVLIARTDDERASIRDFRGGVAAVNDRRSNTGMNLFRAAIAPVAGQGPFFADVVDTGSHRASLEAIASGAADLAAIDRVTYAAVARFEPDLAAGVRIVAYSLPSPTLPFVTAAGTDTETVAALHVALGQIFADPNLADARDTLFLTGMTTATPTSLSPTSRLEADAIRAGYPQLR